MLPVPVTKVYSVQVAGRETAPSVALETMKPEDDGATTYSTSLGTATVTRLPPPELLVVPESVQPIDLDTATESDVALFIKNVWDRMVKLESNVIGVAEFFKDANEVPDEAR